MPAASSLPYPHNVLCFLAFRVLVQEVSSQEALYTKVKDLVQDLSKAALVSSQECITAWSRKTAISVEMIHFSVILQSNGKNMPRTTPCSMTVEHLQGIWLASA